MSVEKGVPLGYSLRGMRDVRGKQHRPVRGRRKAGSRAPDHQRSCPEPGSRGAQMLREKLWVPWNGLIVIGKRMELQSRNTQKPRMSDPKADPEYWRQEGVEKRVSKEKSGKSQEKMDVKPPHSVADALQASAELGQNSPRAMWGKQEIRGQIGAEFESVRTAAGSRRGSSFKDRLKFTGERTSGEDLRSRGYTLGQNEEERRSSGERLSGEKLRSSGEKLRSSREKLRSSGEKLGSSGERLKSREKLSGEKLRSSREKLRSSGEKLSGEKLRSSKEKLRSSGEKLGSSGENHRFRREKLGTSGEDLRSTGDKLQSSAVKLGTSGEKLEDSGMGSIDEERIERVVEVTNAELEIPVERVEGNDEGLEGAEEAGTEEVLGGVNDIAVESVTVEEKEVVGEGSGE